MKELKTEIEIKSDATKVWEVITDFKNYSNWNPIIHKIIGEPKIGTRLEVHIKTVSGRHRIYHPQVTRVRPPRELGWFGKFFFSAVFSGERVFLVETLSDNRVNFINKEIFSGLGVRFAPKTMEEDIIQSFEKMNESLKKTIEK